MVGQQSYQPKKAQETIVLNFFKKMINIGFGLSQTIF